MNPIATLSPGLTSGLHAALAGVLPAPTGPLLAWVAGVAVLLLGLVAVWHLRTARRWRLAQKNLAEREDRWRSAIEGSSDGVWDWNPETDDVNYSAWGSHLLGFSAAELENQADEWRRRVHPDDTAAFEGAIQAHLSGRTPQLSMEYRIQAKSGEWRWVLSRGRVIERNAQGRACRAVGTHTDITAQKQAEAAARRVDEFNSAILTTVDALIIVLDPTGHIVRFNPAAERLSGWSFEEVKGRIFWEIFVPEEQREGVREVFNRLTAGMFPSWYENDWLTRSGGRRWIAWANSVVFDARGNIDYVIGTGVDVSARKSAEQAIRSLNADLERRVTERTAELAQRVAEVEKLNAEQQTLVHSLATSQRATDEALARFQQANASLMLANQELESFSYSVSHDLRAPLRNIMGFLELLQNRTRGTLEPETARYISVVATEAERLSTLIDDLLAFSRINRAELRLERVSMNALVADAIERLRPETEGRTVVWHVTPLPEVRGDRALLAQVVINLLSNAVKFTRHREEAVIEVGPAGTPDKDGLQAFRVADNGAGFNPKYQDKLFGVFQRLHSTRDFEGTGIGLANVKRIVSRHGGRVWAEGRLDKGAVFHFTLPCDPPTP